MKFNCIIAVAFLIAVALAEDIITYDVTFTCSRGNLFNVNATVIELDSFTNDKGEVKSVVCKENPCKFSLEYKDSDDGIFDNEYELQLHLKHDCTADQKFVEVDVQKDKDNKYWSAPIGKETKIVVDYKI